MVLIPRGTFWMGSPDEPHEGPVHEVWLSPYVIDRTDTEIAELEKKRAQIEETLAELRVINSTSSAVDSAVAARCLGSRGNTPADGAP